MRGKIKNIVLFALIFAASLVQAQENVSFRAYETLFNGKIAIYELCSITNMWGIDYYPSVNTECWLQAPDDSIPFNYWGGYYSNQSWVQTSPPFVVSESGNWEAHAGYYTGLYQGTDAYYDYDGYWYEGIQTCDGDCSLYGNGQVAFITTNWNGIAESDVNVYIDPVTVQVYPSSVSLDGGD
jgi:hypothetical protein